MKLTNLEREIELNPTQARFVDCMGTRYQGFFGGIGNGKTQGGVVKADLIAENFPGSMGLIGRQDFTDLNRTTLRDFFKWRPDLRSRYNASTHLLRYPNGSEILFSELSDTTGLLSLNLDWYWVDQGEETTEEAHLTLNGRLRGTRGPRLGFYTGNPAGHDFIWRRFKQGMHGKDYVLFEAPSQENERNLPSDYIASLLANAPDAWVKRYVYGSWDAFEGLIWPEFVEARHCVTPFEIPWEWERFRVIDHGRVNPTACLWFAVDFDGTVYVYREYYKPGLVEHHAPAIRDAEKLEALTYLDPSAFGRNQEKDGILCSVADQYQEHGIFCTPANNDVRGGIDKVGEFFKAGRLKIFKGCENLVRELGDYQWKKLKGALLGEKNAPEEPRKVNDHACDALRYGVMTVVTHRPARPRDPEAPFDVMPAGHGIRGKHWRSAPDEVEMSINRGVSGYGE